MWTGLLRGLLGGTILAVSTSTLLLLVGKITGISGIVHNLLNQRDGGWKSWRISYLAGLLASGPVVAALGWNALGPFGSLREPASQYFHPVPVILSGLLVGFGSRLGNGCTSGHGLCALPRLSPRSFVAVCTFMATGAAMTALVQYTKLGEFLYSNSHPGYWGWAFPAAALLLSLLLFRHNAKTKPAGHSDLAAADGLAAPGRSAYSSLDTTSPREREQRQPLALADGASTSEHKIGTDMNASRQGSSGSGSVASTVPGTPPAQSIGDKPIVHIASFLCALVFGVGLGVSGMTNPKKIHGFLDFGALLGAGKGTSSWDPTLIGVMGGAVALNMVFFQLLLRYAPRPVCYKTKVPTSPPPSPEGPKATRCDSVTEACPAMSDVLVMGPKAPANRVIDTPLVLGSAIFGLGWGLAGICPGPGIVTLSAGVPHAPLFCGSMMLGMIAFEKFYVERRKR